MAWVGGMMCSLAYWIGSQASAVVSTRSAMVGSIGAYVSVVDYHRMLANAGIEVKVFTNKEGTFKAAGMPGAPITSEHAAEFSREAQRSFEVFRADVLRRREGIPAEAMAGPGVRWTPGQAPGLGGCSRGLQLRPIGGPPFGSPTLKSGRHAIGRD
ncbi:MAG: S49 family peptidase [Verrucomicrobia bacterium]|nr:S49 family peptidase [Verrucomicrobiota bacterium]